MSTPLKLLLGVLSFGPAVGLVWTTVLMAIGFFTLANAGGSADPEQLVDLIRRCLPVSIVTSVITLALLAFYIWHLVTHGERKDGGFVVLWCLLLVLLPLIAMPVYWWLYIRPKRDPELLATSARRNEMPG